jgi:hypothetical protein
LLQTLLEHHEAGLPFWALALLCPRREWPLLRRPSPVPLSRRSVRELAPGEIWNSFACW